LSRLYALLGGHPFLTRKALNDLATGAVSLKVIETRGDQTDGHFGDHLRRMLILLARDPEMQGELQAFLHDGRRLSEKSFHRLRSAGVLAGANPEEAVPRCALYGRYLRQNLT
jgi:hypothetical protein